MRVLALIAAYNERRFIEPCLAHLGRHGVDAYLIDNESTDGTVALAERHLGRNLAGIESFPRGKDDVYDWRKLLRRKEELASELEADWFIHLDPDELRLPPAPGPSLAAALEAVDREGFNAVNFLELSFVPTRESPEHDHPGFERTLRTYYPLLPEFPHRLNAWKATAEVELEWKAGHRARFPGLRMYPRSFLMKHYLFLGRAHAVEKFVERNFNPEEVASGWFGWRAGLSEADIVLQSESELRTTRSDADLDPSNPRKRHYLDELWRARTAAGP